MILPCSPGCDGAHRGQDMRPEMSIGSCGNVLVDANQMPGMRAALPRELQWQDPPRYCPRPRCRVHSFWGGQVKSADMLGK